MINYIHKVIFFLLLIATSTSLMGQIKRDTTVKKNVQSQEKKVIKYMVRGIIAGETNEETLPGAHIYVGADKKPTTVTNAMGEFTLTDLIAGEVIITASFVGYKSTTKKYLVKADTNVRIINLFPDILEEVLIVAKPPLILQKGDTTEFNAAAVKVPEDAELEDLLKKLPGFQIIDGKLMANGEEVQRIYIDGTEYFLNNPMDALQTLPASLVAKIKMFDGKSDIAEFSGYNDGKKYRSLNIETKNPNQLKVFGKTSLGYGISEDPEDSFKNNNYNLEVSGNAFNKKRKISARGSLRNTNQGSDLPDSQYKGKGGDNQGKNFSFDIFNTFNKGIELTGSYNSSNNESYSANSSKQDYFPTENFESRIFNSESHSWSKSSNNSMTSRLNYDINKKNQLNFSPSFSFNKSDSRSLRLGNSIENNDTINITNAKSLNHSESNSFNGDLSWMHGFEKRGRTLSLNARINTTKKNSNGIQQDSSIINKRDTLRNLINTTKTLGNTFSGSISYSEPLSEHSRLAFNYSFNYNRDESDKKSMSYRDVLFTELIGIDTALTNKINNIRTSNQAGINYNCYKEKLNINGGVSINFSNQKNTYVYLNVPDSIVKSSYFDLSPNFDLGYSISKKSRLNINYNGNTSSPSAGQLQNILDVSNQLQVSKGNPNLKKTYFQSASVSYNSSIISAEEVSFLNMRLSFNNSFNTIETATQFINNDTIINGYQVLQGARLTMPVNLNGKWGISMNSSYSFEIKKLKLRLNPSISYDYSHSPSIYDNIKNITNAHNVSFRLGISSNISENLDYNINSNTSYSTSSSTTTGGSNSFHQSADASVKWVFWKEFILAGNYSYSYSLSKKGGNIDQSNSLLNLEIGKKFLKQKQLQVNFKAIDLLRQKNILSYSIHDLYAKTSYNTNTRDYYRLSISYRFNSIGKKSNSQGNISGEF